MDTGILGQRTVADRCGDKGRCTGIGDVLCQVHMGIIAQHTIGSFRIGCLIQGDPARFRHFAAKRALLGAVCQLHRVQIAVVDCFDGIRTVVCHNRQTDSRNRHQQDQQDRKNSKCQAIFFLHNRTSIFLYKRFKSNILIIRVEYLSAKSGLCVTIITSLSFETFFKISIT